MTLFKVLESTGLLLLHTTRPRRPFENSLEQIPSHHFQDETQPLIVMNDESFNVEALLRRATVETKCAAVPTP